MIDRKSITGYVLKIAGGPVVWSSRKQKLVTTSTSEAELVALSEATKEVMYLLAFFRELEVEVHTPVTIHVDNRSTIQFAENHNVNHGRSKHIDVKYFFIREQIKNKIIKLNDTRSAENIADIFTKSTEKKTFDYLVPKIMGEK